MIEFINSISKLDAFIIGIVIGVMWLAFEKITETLTRKKTNSVEKEPKKEIERSELLEYILTSKGEEKGQQPIYETILSFIDSFIDNALETYFELEAKPEDHYITAEETAVMNRYILASVSKNMTPEVIHIISLVYNINTDEELTKLLKLRIKLKMVKVLVNVNKPVE